MKNLIVLVVLFTSVCFAQESIYKSYDWENPSQYQASTLDSNESMITVKEKTIKEFLFEGEDGLFEYSIEHKAIWLNSDAAIEDYNKVYLPYNSNSTLISSKARVVQSDGSVQELDESKIHTAKDEETNNTYKYFAFEGIEKGSIVEYFFVLKKYPSYQGTRIFLQSAFNKKNVDFDLYAPSNLIFAFKSYNGIHEVQQDTLTKDRLHWSVHENDIKKLEKEDVSAYEASRGFIIYKLDKNTANDGKNISSYSNLTKNIYSFLNPELKKADIKLMDDFAKELKLLDKSDEEKVRSIENHIKTNFYVTTLSGDQYKDITAILKNKTGSKIGLIRLYYNLFKHLEIATEIVSTTDRFDLFFDKDFEANIFLNEYLFYFKEFDKYLSPYAENSRLGVPPAELTDNYGLFIKEIKIGDFKSGVGKIKYIEALGADKSSDNIKMEVSFNEDDLSVCTVDYSGSFSGYYASYIQPYLNQIEADDREEFYKSLVHRFDPNMDVKKVRVENAKPELLGVKPFIVHSNFESNKFMEKAGRKLVFKLGELIGPQIEMYQENKRVLGVESDFNRTYNRTITIKIPKGYKIDNLEQIKIQNSFSIKDKTVLLFDSSYTLSGNTLEVVAYEFYDVNRIALADFEQYRTVINSAADFNKIVLVLEPDNIKTE